MEAYEKYRLQRVINASGKMTILGGSRVKPEVIKASNIGAENFFVIKELREHVEAYLAEKLNVPETYIVTSASAGIAQCVAAAVVKDQLAFILNPYDKTIEKREVVICKGHVVNYGTPISLPIMMGGGIVKEAGYANECTLASYEACINEKTAALMFVKSHHCVQKGMPKLQDIALLATKYQLPLIVDAAAEEDLTKYLIPGVSAVIYSGTKALSGPTSGLVIGQGSLMEWIKKQPMGLGRVMKVGKEAVLGLAEAVEQYLDASHLSLEQQRERLSDFNCALNALNGVRADCVQDEAGRLIIRSQIKFDSCYDASKIAAKLKMGNPAIYTRDYRVNLNMIEIDVRDVTDAELIEISARIKEILEEE